MNTAAGAAVARAKTLIKSIKPGPFGTASNLHSIVCEIVAALWAGCRGEGEGLGISNRLLQS
jgi:hypothetical protein